jgi:hypothetical protein
VVLLDIQVMGHNRPFVHVPDEIDFFFYESPPLFWDGFPSILFGWISVHYFWKDLHPLFWVDLCPLFLDGSPHLLNFLDKGFR